MAFRASTPIALLFCMLPGALLAQEPEQVKADRPDVPELSDAQPHGAPALSTSASPFGSAIDEATLGTVAGREDTTQVSHANQVAGVTRSSVGDNAVTGDARIDGNAFQNMSGLSILNVNTGNNVAINAAMNVNVSIQPGP